MDALLEKFNGDRKDGDGTDRVTVEEVYDVENPFQLKYADRDYSYQYYHMYQHRLDTLRERTVKTCLRRWDDDFRLNGRPVVQKAKVLDIKANEPSWCVGTVYCEMQYKPNILEDVVNDTLGAPDLVKSYTDPEGSDEIMLEDESGRVLLVGDFITGRPFVSGIVIGVLGMEAEAGTFQVVDICYPEALPQRALPMVKDGGSKKIALVSGLNISTKDPDRIFRVQLLQEYLMGRLSEQDSVSQIGKLLICGDSVDSHNHSDEVQAGVLASCLQEFGNFLANILQTIPVGLLPGANDPSDRALPQQPLNKALFSQALHPYFDEANNSLLHLVTNPFNFQIQGLDILAVSGQSISDICKYIIPYRENSTDSDSSNGSGIKDTVEHRLDLIQCTLNWQNIAPTVPDTLWSYPFVGKDPFILDRWPHVYVVGNQPGFGVRDVDIHGKKIKIIALPQFSSTGQVILLDTQTLEVDVVDVLV